MGNKLSITTISNLKTYKNGVIVELPEFAEGQPFIARVIRPSMLVLAKEGKIPNSLLTVASELFTQQPTNRSKGKENDATNIMAEMYEICEIIAEASLLEPTYEEIKEAGIKLTDEQLMAIFSYSQNGIKALESFRTK